MTMAELDGKGCGPESGSPFEGEEAVRMEESSPITVFRNVNKYFGSLHVLKDLNFEIMRGEVVVICGPSGSGKSTLIRCINKLEPIASGEIVVDGVNLKSRSREITKLRADIGMVFQHFNLYPHLTVLQNVALAPVLVRGISKPEGHDYARELLGKVGILNKESAYPGLLSGGQQQRVAIARAMAMNPKILLFDEPTSALDPEMIQEVLDVMVALAREGMTMVVVTHEMGFARKVPDRIVFMESVRIVEQNSPSEFFRNPRDERPRQFLSKILVH